ncbi:MAG: aminodeoxychorismate synthase component I [bacterium]
MLTKVYQGECDLLALYRQNPKRYPFLLESVTHAEHHALSRYSLLFAFPLQCFSTSFPQLRNDQSFCQQLDEQMKLVRQTFEYDQPKTDLPFHGGWFVALNYELVAELEPSLNIPAHDFSLPSAVAVRIPAAIIIDHHQHQTHLVAEPQQTDAFAQMQADIEPLVADTISAEPLSSHYQTPSTNTEATDSINKTAVLATDLQSDQPKRYCEGVSRIREYIAAGDVFQVNYSREWRGELLPNVHNADLYARLREANPAPFAALCDFGDWSIISSSPERLVCVNDGVIETRPIAGTRPRSACATQDQALLAELLAHPKERAEHIMLIDLERNDLGRICETGSIEVNELMVLESYEHVHHIVSNVRGRLRKDVSVGDMIRAVFPGGTITGCPKVRCMEIIAEQEQTGRGAYTGSVGYINHNGDLDLNILIRSMVRKNNTISLRTGAGIVFDSQAERELEETEHKVKGLLNALL